MQKVDEEISIVDRIKYYNHLSGLNYLVKDQDLYGKIIPNMEGDLYKYAFFTDFLNDIKMTTDINTKKREVNVLYAMMQCLYKIDSDRLVTIRSRGIKTEKDDFYETPFLNEIIVLLDGFKIDPAYKRFHNYFQNIDEKTIKFSILTPIICENLSNVKEGARTKGTELLDFLRENQSAISDGDCELIKLILDDHLKLSEEIETEIAESGNESKKYPPNFHDLTISAQLVRAVPEITYALTKKCIHATSRFQEIIKSYDLLLAEVKAKNNAKIRQNEAETKEKAEKDAARRAEMAEKRAEKELKFSEEQALRQREYEERVQGYHANAAAEAERHAAEKAARQQELTMKKSATPDIKVPAKRDGPKVKTRGAENDVAGGDADAHQLYVELVQHVARVIPENIREFVTEVMQADFDTVKNHFERQMGATVTLTKGNKWVFSFRSPVNNELLRFYADNPHGAQNEKFRTAWRALMQDALERGEMKLR
jgi:hypothetical protein